MPCTPLGASAVIPTQVPFRQPVRTRLSSAPNLPPTTHSCQFSEFCTASQSDSEMIYSEATTLQADLKFPPPQDFNPSAELQFRETTKDDDDGVRRAVFNVEDLMDANFAGTKLSSDCTLILTEGRATMSLAVAGLSVLAGRDLNLYGLYAVKRRLINACKFSLSEVMKDSEAKNIVQVLGLRSDFTYEEPEELKTMRYGKVLLMMDRDEDGSHMKGLIMNLFYKYWPALLRKNAFLMQFSFPVVKVWISCVNSRNHVIPFHTVEDYENWMEQLDKSGIRKLGARHYRSLESFTPGEIKEFFSNLRNNCLHFRYEGPEDHRALTLAFEKGREDLRKEWIRRALRESFLHYEDLTEIRYEDFVNKELLFYSDLQNLRSFPSAIDGLTRSQRKVLHAYFKRHYGQEVGLLRLIGSVLDVSAYKQDVDALGKTVINMAQDFVGANNINILMPIGQFGTRRHGGKDAGKVKYLHTKVNGVAEYIFSESDFPILNYRRENDFLIEPEYFLPIIPMILVNGSEGIGMGWKTKIPKYKPKDIITNLFRMLDGLEPENMVPSFKNFDGNIERVSDSQFYTYGKILIPGDNQIRIVELPIGVWTEAYKEKVLNQMLGENGEVSRYEEFHTDTSVNFLVTLRTLDPQTLPEEDLYNMFHLKNSEKCQFVAFDHRGLVQDYENPVKILKEYFDVRLQAYEARKTHMIEKLQFDQKSLEDSIQKARYGGGNTILPNLHGETRNFAYDVEGIQQEEINSLENDMRKTGEKLEQLSRKSAADLWREDLEALCSKLDIAMPNPRPVNDESLNETEFISSMNSLSI